MDSDHRSATSLKNAFANANAMSVRKVTDFVDRHYFIPFSPANRRFDVPSRLVLLICTFSLYKVVGMSKGRIGL
jgi:hypothetical protein